MNVPKSLKAIGNFFYTGEKSNPDTRIQATGNAFAQAGFNTSRSYFYGSSRSGGAKYEYGLSASGNTHHIDHYETRLNARAAYHDSVQARGLVERIASSVAGAGVKLESQPRFEILGISPEEAEAWGNELEQRFDSWANDKEQHRSGMMTFYQAQRLFQTFTHRDNDIFARLYYDGDEGLQNPLQFSFIDPFQIRGDAYTYSDGFLGTDDGIDRDSRGRAVNYKVWIMRPDEKGQYDEVDIPAKSSSGRLFMLHCFRPEYAGQERGYSRLGHALQEFENLTDFTLAVITKAINQSNITMYVKPSQDQAASNIFENILTDHGVGPAGNRFAQAGGEASVVHARETGGNPVQCHEIPEATLDRPGSTAVFNLQEGEDLKPFADNTSAQQFDKFLEAFMSEIAAAFGLPYEVYKMQFGANYSASRATLVLFWRVVEEYRKEMADNFLNPVFEMWLSEEIAAGRVKAPGFSDPRMRKAWLNCQWIGDPLPNIDPAKTAKADKEYIEMGAQTPDMVARNLNGTSGAANRAKNARQIEELTVPPWAGSAAPAPSAAGINEEEDNGS